MKFVLFGNYAMTLKVAHSDLVDRILALGHEVLLVAPEEISADLIWWPPGAKVRYIALPMERVGTSLVKDFTLFRKLLSILKSERPDVILSRTIKPVVYGALAGRIAGVKKIGSYVTGLGSVFDPQASIPGRAKWLGPALMRMALRLSSAVFVSNSSDMDYLRAKGFLSPRSDVKLVNGNGVNLKRYTRQPAVTDPVRFIFVARLLREKGVFDFVDAARIIKKRWPLVEFQILGPFDDNPSVVSKELVAEWEKEGVITYLGETTDVRPYLAQASVVVLPSYYKEGLSQILLEGLATGRALITTDHPGCRETVREGRNGFLVAKKNPESLAGAMQKIIESPGILGRMGEESRRLAESAFDADEVVNTMIQALGLTASGPYPATDH